jgi:fructose-bisphosphate aldolase class I
MEQHKINMQALESTAQKMVADGKGLIAIDESIGTCNKRFAKWNIPQTEETRRQYRDLLVTTPGLGESISGAILFDETIRQRTDGGAPFAKAIVDAGIHFRDQSGRRGEADGRMPWRDGHRGSGWTARTAFGVCADGGALRQVAGSVFYRRWNAQ